MDTDILMIPTARTKKGDIIAKDILSTSGQLLVAKNTPINTSVKTKLFAFGLTQIPIFNNGLLQSEATTEKTNSIPKEVTINFTDFKSSAAETLNEILPTDSLTKNQHSTCSIKTYTQFRSIELPRTLAIKSNPIFKKYKKIYEDSLIEYKTELKDMVLNDKPIDTNNLLKLPLQFLDLQNEDFDILELLHNIQHSDDVIFDHSFNVALVCGVISKLIKMSPIDTKFLLISALLHDIGKLLLPPDILNKPSNLTNEEYNIVVSHTILGYKLVKDHDFDPRIKACILMHHEKCDGSGYPSKLNRDRLPEFVKILSIADVYCALVSKRLYRDAICPFDVIKIFETEGFQKYDPRILFPFLHHLAKTYIDCRVLLNDGRIGTIIMLNENNLSRPLLSIKNSYLDLSKDYSLSIIEVL